MHPLFHYVGFNKVLVFFFRIKSVTRLCNKINSSTQMYKLADNESESYKREGSYVRAIGFKSNGGRKICTIFFNQTNLYDCIRWNWIFGLSFISYSPFRYSLPVRACVTWMRTSIFLTSKRAHSINRPLDVHIVEWLNPENVRSFNPLSSP